LEKASAEVIWEVCGDVFIRDLCGPRGLLAGKEEKTVGGRGVSWEGQAEFRRVSAELRWGVEGGGVEWVVVEVGSRWIVGDGCDRCSVKA
jgi:hypothetical protein